MERIKEMNFRIPAPVVKRSANRNAVTRLSKFQIGRPSFAPPSVGLKAELNKSGLEVLFYQFNFLNMLTF